MDAVLRGLPIEVALAAVAMVGYLVGRHRKLNAAQSSEATRRELKRATLILDPGWLEGSTLNTIEPSPVGQASADGSLSFELGHIPAGRSFILFLDFQTNPTNVGHRHQTVTLYDGARKVLTVHRTITVFP